VAQDTFYPPDTLRQFASRCLQAVGVPAADAETVADNLTDSHLRGVDSHGVTRLIEVYVEQVEAGIINPRPDMRLVEDSTALGLLDADNGLGAVAGTRAMRLCIEKAREVGAAWVGVRNSNHFGACAYYTNQMAAHGLVGIGMTNAPPTMAPWGGIEPYFGTNPLGVSFPTRSGTPISVDLATSVAARGYILLAAAKGEPIPPGWAQDTRGRPTTDAQQALEGTVLPMAGHKGYALALMIDVMCGVLTGAGFGHGLGQLYGDLQRPQSIGHLLGAIDISRFIPLEQFYDRIDQMAREIRATPLAEGVAQIFVPGDIEAAKTEQRRREGIPVAEPIRRQFVALGQRLGVPFE
jgi:LDH2 family malate/lactate/ureidoglycolate dehydrogenase